MTDVQKIAFDTLKAGAPGLSDQTREVLAGIIARKVALSTTPARAEAQDEGAAGPGGWLINSADGVWEWTGVRMAGVAAMTEGLPVWSVARGAYEPVSAHPSPTPAAQDDDRVRAEIKAWTDTQFPKSCRVGSAKWVDGLTRRVLAALKSEGK